MDSIIVDYRCQLEEAACAPGSGRYSLSIVIPNDISVVFPYLNAVLNETIYDHKNKILIGRDEYRRYAFRQKEIRITGINESRQMRQAAQEVVAKVNKIWQERNQITPSINERSLPTVIEIYNILPRTNCHDCGYVTCLAFAADLRRGNVQLEQCSPLFSPRYSEYLNRIQNLVASF